MEVPVGFFAKLWSFLSLLPFFLLLLFLGILKAAIIGPLAAAILVAGNSAVIIGLWPAHFFWTYFCIVKTKRLGLVLKMVVLLILPVPVVSLPILGILGSLLLGVGYGYITPLFATFEAVGEEVIDKLYHCFADGCRNTLEGACTMVRDFTDFCFHSYFSYMDELSENVPEGEKPYNIDLREAEQGRRASNAIPLLLPSSCRRAATAAATAAAGAISSSGGQGEAATVAPGTGSSAGEQGEAASGGGEGRRPRRRL
ncbi:hypothetical protein Taro_052010 [Colocasia esculenta]|uniref:Uncharacterized protein n=1 Tax=Colocasia esculenta TaxID=4460 RepID=A0A843XHH5_COLES|nr:hypothetical protein [Colocasia esculenta]